MASNKRASISANLRADATGWKRGCDTARAEIAKLKADVEKTRIKGPTMDGGGIKKAISGGFTELNSKVTFVQGLKDNLKSLTDLGTSTSVWIGDIRDSLAAMTGDEAEAEKHLQKLLAISEEMALTDQQFESLVDYSVKLQRMGQSADEAANTVRDIANAAEWAGKSIEQMAGTVEAMDKMNQNAEATRKTIIQLSKDVPELDKALNAAFGVSKAADIENLNLSAEDMIAGLRRGLASLPTAQPGSAERLESKYGRTKQGQYNTTTGEAFKDSLPERRQLSEEEAKAARLAAERAAKEREALKAANDAAGKYNEINAKLRDMVAEDERASDIERARANGVAKRVDELEDEADFQREVAELQREGQKLDDAQLDTLRQIIAARRQDKETIRQINQQKELAKSEEDFRIGQLRQTGRNRRADDEERFGKKVYDPNRAGRPKRVGGEMQRLVDSGMDPEAARRMLDLAGDADEDAALGPGRRRIRRNVPSPKLDVPSERRSVKSAKDKEMVTEKGGGLSAVSGVIGQIVDYVRRIADNTTQTAANRQQPARRK